LIGLLVAASCGGDGKSEGVGPTADYFAEPFDQMIADSAERDRQCAAYIDELRRPDAIWHVLSAVQTAVLDFKDAQRHLDYVWSDEGVQTAHDHFFAMCPITVPVGYHFETLDDLCASWNATNPVPEGTCQ